MYYLFTVAEIAGKANTAKTFRQYMNKEGLNEFHTTHMHGSGLSTVGIILPIHDSVKYEAGGSMSRKVKEKEPVRCIAYLSVFNHDRYVESYEKKQLKK